MLRQQRQESQKWQGVSVEKQVCKRGLRLAMKVTLATGSLGWPLSGHLSTMDLGNFRTSDHKKVTGRRTA